MSDTSATKSVEKECLKVGAGSAPQSVASAIAHAIYEFHTVNVRAVGAGAVNQAVKSIAIASGFVAPRGLRLNTIIGFQTIEGNDGPISAMVFTVSTT